MMGGPSSLHNILRRQLRHLGLSDGEPPNPEQWVQLMEAVNGAYEDLDAARYRLQRALEISSAEMRALLDALRWQARHDPLTGLPNRIGLNEYLDVQLERCRAEGGRLSVLFIDLDDFKLINDSLGHSAGDELLMRVAERISRTVADEGVVARLGGDEFVVAVADSKVGMPELERRIRVDIERPVRVDNAVTSVRASIGVGYCDGGIATIDGLLGKADSAMYAVKRERRQWQTVSEGEGRGAESGVSGQEGLPFTKVRTRGGAAV